MIKYLVMIGVCAVVSVAGFARLDHADKTTEYTMNSIELTDDAGQFSKAVKGYYGIDTEVLQNASTTKVFQLTELNQTQVSEVLQKSKDIENLRLHSLTITAGKMLQSYDVKIVYAVQ